MVYQTNSQVAGTKLVGYDLVPNYSPSTCSISKNPTCCATPPRLKKALPQWLRGKEWIFVYKVRLKKHWPQSSKVGFSMDWFSWEILDGKPWIFPWGSWAFPVEIFPEKSIHWVCLWFFTRNDGSGSTCWNTSPTFFFGASPQMGWCLLGKLLVKWMIWGSPYLRKPPYDMMAGLSG